MSDLRRLDKYSSIPEAFFDFADKNPDALVYQQALFSGADKEAAALWQTRNYLEVSERVRKISGYLKKQGVEPGDRVAIISQSRSEWLEADLAVLAIGAVSVSVYQTLPAADIGYILFDSETKVIFAENQEQVDKLLWLTKNLVSIPATEERAAQEVTIKINKIISFEITTLSDTLIVDLSSIITSELVINQNLLAKLKRDDLATFVYTSGTTGAAKGVVQTHGNHLSNCRQAWVAGMLKEGASIMVFLPLAHSFAKLMGYLGALSNCYLKFPRVADRTTSSMQPDLVMQDIRVGSATIVPIVPRMLEKMQSGIQAKSRMPGMAAKLLGQSLAAASQVYETTTAGICSNIIYQGTSPIRKKIKLQLFGPDFGYCISGGAKLNTDTAKFFDMLGIEILEGYGLTETCVATNVNPLGRKKIGTVGPVLDKDIELKIAEDGEILFRGPNIAKGYYKREAATKAAWNESGWFHTGDLGALDTDNYLSIVGRKKDILVSSYGKNVAPEPVEARIKSSIYISQVVLVGDARPYCIAVVSLDNEPVISYLKAKGIEISKNLFSDSNVRELIQSEINSVNKDLAKHEQIRGLIIAEQDFTIENGLLTPTFKVKKKLVLEQYAEQIKNCYK